jgi:microcystin degradation protein MlrC
MPTFAVGTLSLECNTFSPETTDLRYFRENGYLLYGEEILEYHRHVRNELAGFLNVCPQWGIEPIPTCAAWGVPHGVVDRATYDGLKSEFLTRIRAAMPLDGVYLCLHGSMVVQGLDDPEGDLLESVRAVIGNRALVASLDFHANVTARIARSVDILVGYNSFPHTNTYETGQQAAALAGRFHAQVADLRRVFIKIPLIVPMERMTIVGDEPMVPLMRDLARLEGQEGFLALSLYGVQCWLDIEEMGCAAFGVCRKERLDDLGRELARLAKAFWDLREVVSDFPFHTPEAAIREGLSSPDRPILLNEPSDNVGAGATGDSTYVLEALLRERVTEPVLIPIVDPEAVAAAIRVGVGRETDFLVGGKLNRGFSHPVKLRGRVRTISDGRYRYRGPVYHGVETSMGRTVVLQVQNALFVELTELPAYTIDPEHYRCVGLFPERAKFVVVKSQGSFKASYASLAKRVFYLDTPGISGSNILRLPFTKIDRNATYPFRKELTFTPQPQVFG